MSASAIVLLVVSCVAVAWLLISGIRLCRQVEDRSEKLRNFSNVARQARLLHVAMNWDVALDAETQALRWRMINRFLAIATVCLIVTLADWIGLLGQ
jgi:hypothetical protein